MNDDLKIIKKKFGEDMMRLCRKIFPTILDKQPGHLSDLLLANFNPNKSLCHDIIVNNLVSEFRNYILKNEISNIEKASIDKTPEELLKMVHYTLYECNTEEEIQSFTKYYQDKERLCTFRTNRLKDCYVFFAIKDNAISIKREDFPNPKRQDEYGTSVISIQFTKDPSHMLSIKNRYNHTVPNPDATFSNNLDNIIPGLTLSFEKHYGLKQKYIHKLLDIPNYVLASDGKLYKYNYEINNIYYCPDNIIIDNFEVKRYPKEKYLIMDYFIIDLVNKKVFNYDIDNRDTFPSTIPDIKNVVITNNKDTKKVVIVLKKGKDIVIYLDKNNKIVSIEDDNIVNIPTNYLLHNSGILSLKVDNATTAGTNVLFKNQTLEYLSASKLQIVGNAFLYHNNGMKSLNIPNVIEVGSAFMYLNESLQRLTIPKLIRKGNGFLYVNSNLEELNISNIDTTFENNYLNILLARKYSKDTTTYNDLLDSTSRRDRR